MLSFIYPQILFKMLNNGIIVIIEVFTLIQINEIGGVI